MLQSSSVKFILSELVHQRLTGSYISDASLVHELHSDIRLLQLDISTTNPEPVPDIFKVSVLLHPLQKGERESTMIIESNVYQMFLKPHL